MARIFSTVGWWIVGLLVCAVVCALAGALGYTGLLVRRGRRWPALMWAGIYLILFFIVPSKFFFLSLLGMIPVVLGFFGIFLTPDIDG